MTTDARSVPRFPLEWPLGWKRCRSRRAGQFSQGETRADGRKDRRAISVETATLRLEREIAALGVKDEDVTLSTNLRLNMRGLPRGDERPADPGVAVYFAFRGRATVLACDTYYGVADNIAALAAHIAHLRAIERHGVGTIEQALAGYRALPADTAADWRAVFGFTNGERPTLEDVKSRHRLMASDRHPDKGGTDEGMMHINRARDYALEELKG